MSQSLLIVISGPSGVGKNTVINNLSKRRPELKYSISATTRNPRPNEIDGQHYFFLTQKQFREKIKAGEFLEWAKVYNHYYGTLRQYVQQLLESGHNVILDIEVQGAIQVKRSYPESVLIFLAPPSLGELKRRLLNRKTEPEAELSRRLQYIETEFQAIFQYDYLVINQEIDLTCEQIECIIQAEQCRVFRQDRTLLDRILSN